MIVGWLGMLGTGELQRFDYVEMHMGVEVQLTYYCDSQERAEAAGRAVFARFEDLEQKMSDYRPSSEVRQLQEKAVKKWTKVSGDLWKVLEFGQRVASASSGAFDMTAGPYVALWRQSRNSGRSPSYPALLEAREKVGWQHLELDAGSRSVRIMKEGVKIDLGGIAKGYACDEAIAEFERHGIRAASVVAGGDLKVSAAPPGSQGWKVRVTGEHEPMTLTHRAVSTSGDTEQFVELWGVRYSHIVDPRHGFGVQNRIQATVMARNGLTTDPLATAFCVLGEAGRSRLEIFGAEAQLLVVEEDQ